MKTMKLDTHLPPVGRRIATLGLTILVSCFMSLGTCEALAKATTTKSPTQAQKLSKALKACKKKPKKKRAACRKRARKKYATHRTATARPPATPSVPPPALVPPPAAGKVGAATGSPAGSVGPVAGAQYYHFLNNMPLAHCNDILTGSPSTNFMELEFKEPDDVRSLYAAEWVYFRPIWARADSVSHGYGEWQRGLATPTGLSYVTVGAFLFKSQWTTEDGLEAKYAEFFNLYSGVIYYVGYQIYWSETKYTDTQWPFTLNGSCSSLRTS